MRNPYNTVERAVRFQNTTFIVYDIPPWYQISHDIQPIWYTVKTTKISSKLCPLIYCQLSLKFILDIVLFFFFLIKSNKSLGKYVSSFQQCCIENDFYLGISLHIDSAKGKGVFERAQKAKIQNHLRMRKVSSRHIFSPLIHSIVFTVSVCGQRRP